MADAQNNRITGTSSGLTVAGSAGNVSLSGSGLGVGWLFQAESIEPITHVWFRGGARTGTPPAYSIRLEGVDTSGNPDNADLGGGSPTAKIFTPPADTTWNGAGQWIALTNAYTPTLGQTIYITIRYSSGTIDASNFFSFTSSLSGLSSGNRNAPFTTSLSAGVWTKSISASPLVAWKGASGVYGFPTTGAVTVLTSAATSGRKMAAKVTIPTAFGSTFTVKHFEMCIDIGAAGGTVVLGIWDSSGTAVATITRDTDWFASPILRTLNVTLESQPALSTGVPYYFGVEATGGTVPGIQCLQMTSADDRAAFPLGLLKCESEWDGSAWTDDTTLLPLIEITAADITVPSGGTSGAIVIGS